MEGIIRTLKDMRVKAERLFVDNSLIARGMSSAIDSPVINNKNDLEMIAELNEAISTLENSKAAKNSTT